MARPEVNELERPALERQRSRDLSARIRSGILFYPVIWMFIGAGMMLQAPSYSKFYMILGILILESTITAIRFKLLAIQEAHCESGKPVNFNAINYGITLSGITWSCVFVSALLDTPFREHYSLIITATMGLTSGALVNIAIHRMAVAMFFLSLYTPAIVVVLLGHTNQPPGLALVLFFYTIVMYSLTRLPRNEYERSVISNLRLQKQALVLTELSNNDALTGLRNRRYFESILAQECSRSNRVGYPVSLLIIDIDFFKTINDQFGHMVGDQCLKHVAREIRATFLRSEDTVARIGGEEFAAILPGLKQDSAAKLAESTRLHLANTPFLHNNTPITVTVSIGGTTLNPPHHASPDELYKHSDQALYQSKSQGRNRVTWSKPV